MSSGVVLREVIEPDLPILFEQQLDPVATEMAAFPSRDRDAFMDHWARTLADDDVITRTVLLDGAVAGSLVSFERLGVREVGYWIGREYWGKGVATRALTEFLRVDEARPLHARVAAHNVASIRVLEKCGFTISETELSPAFDDGVEEIILELR
jgi:RimJ/RimL family protein N-acetyltransferase